MRKFSSIRSAYPITVSELASFIPSAFAVNAWEKMSNKYSFLSTAEVIHALQGEGYGCFSAKQSGTRIGGKEGYTKHCLRFRKINSGFNQPLVGDILPEIQVINSHCGSAYIVEAGLYRLACGNGLTVSVGSLSLTRVVHKNESIETVLDAVKNVVNQFPLVADTIRKMQERVLTYSERSKFAELALLLRYDMGKEPYEANRLLVPRRALDVGSSLWAVYNVIQENITQSTQRRGRFEHSSRAVRSIDTDLTINRDLWALTQAYA